MRAGSRASELDRRSTPAGASVSRSRRTTTRRAPPATPASTTMPPGADLQALELGERRLDLADEVARRDMEEPVAAAAPADGHDRAVRQEAVGERPKTQAGSANSASIGASGSSRGPSTSRYRFHQPLRSETRWSVPSGRPLGLDDRLVRAARREVGLARASRPAAIGATRRRVASQGMSGWSHSSQASCDPSGREPRRRDEVRPRRRGRAARARRRAARRRSRSTASPSPAWSSRTARSAAGPHRSAGRHSATARPG